MNPQTPPTAGSPPQSSPTSQTSPTPGSSARLVRVALSLGIIALIIFIAQQMWALGQSLGGILSALAASWFLALILRPFVTFLHDMPLVPIFVVRRVGHKYGDSIARRVRAARMPFGAAVGIAYVLVLVLLIGGITIAIAAIIPQATALIAAIPDLAVSLPNTISASWADIAQRMGLDSSTINQFVSAQDISVRIAQIAQLALSQALNIATFTAGALGQTVLVIILSLYIVVEDKLIERQFFAILPRQVHEGMMALILAVQRSFSGYLRGQVVAALVRAVLAFVLFTVFNVPFGIVVGFVYGLLSFIPLIGSPIGILIAGVVILIFQPLVVLPVLIILTILDFVVAYIVLPLLLADTVGVPSLIGLISISLGVQFLGFWGLIFSIPLVGALYAIVFDFWLPRHRARDGLPHDVEEFRDLVYPRRAPRSSTRNATGQKLKEAVRAAATFTGSTVSTTVAGAAKRFDRARTQIRDQQKRKS